MDNIKVTHKLVALVAVAILAMIAIFFSGIPYAKPPVGKLRWKAPEPLLDSDDVFEAKHFGASSIRPGWMM